MVSTKVKNQTFLIIKNSGLDPSIFSVKDETFTERKTIIQNIAGRNVRGTKDEDKIWFVVRLFYSPLLFKISQESSFDMFDYQCTDYNPAYSLTDISYSRVDDLSHIFTNWINTVVKPYLEDSKIPNLWGILVENPSQTINQSIEVQETKLFSEEEKIRVKLSINEFRLLIKQDFNPNQEQFKVINDRLEYLTNALDKHNKFDWKGIAIQTVISIGIALSLSPEKGQQLLMLFKHVFQ